MRRIFYRSAVAWVIGLAFGLSSLAQAAQWRGTEQSEPQASKTDNNGTDTGLTDKRGSEAPASEPSLCLDGMETVPIEDDLEPVPVAVDGGCLVSEAPISI